MFIAGAAKMLLGKDEEAVAWLRRSIEANRNFRNTHVILAAALAQLGRLDEARAAVQAALALDPSLTVRRYRAGIVSDNPTFLAQLERGIDGMRKAGVPEGGERSAIFALQTGCGVRWRDFCNGSMLVKKSTNER
jgi:tetratricopeptide (TPR) repeat protein